MLHNTGQSLVFRVDKDTKQHVNISGGPLGSFRSSSNCCCFTIKLFNLFPSIVAYRYQFEEIYIHYGTENNQGSEHQIHGYAFPGEVSSNILSIMMFSVKFFKNFSPSKKTSHLTLATLHANNFALGYMIS
jgi:hypothetical protein